MEGPTRVALGGESSASQRAREQDTVSPQQAWREWLACNAGGPSISTTAVQPAAASHQETVPGVNAEGKCVARIECEHECRASKRPERM